MLRFKPAGKFNVQVCTNISCMLRGGYEIYERFQEELGIGNKGVTADGVFSLEEVECIGACSWAPAIQVNYDFHNGLTPEQVPTILASYRQANAKATLPGWSPIPMKSRLSPSALGRARRRSTSTSNSAATSPRRSASRKVPTGSSKR
jgi:hypothetical protein